MPIPVRRAGRLNPGRIMVAAAFAQERDAQYAVRMIAACEINAHFRLRRVIDEQGVTQMVVLEVRVADTALAGRVETAMEGSHGVVVPAETLQAAKAG